MTLDSRLRGAASELHEAVAERTPHPIAEVHRSRRRRAWIAATASAAVVAGIVGAAALVLPADRTEPETVPPAVTPTTAPAPELMDEPGPLTFPRLDPIRQAGPGPELTFTPGTPEEELPLLPVDEMTADDVAALLSYEFLDDDFTPNFEEVVAVGRTPDGHARVFAVLGTPTGPGGRLSDCVVNSAGASASCGPSGEPQFTIAVGVDGAYARSGTLSPQAAVIVVEVGDERLWQRTRGGYAYLVVAADVGTPITWTTHDAAGRILHSSRQVIPDPRYFDPDQLSLDDGERLIEEIRSVDELAAVRAWLDEEERRSADLADEEKARLEAQIERLRILAETKRRELLDAAPGDEFRVDTPPGDS